MRFVLRVSVPTALAALLAMAANSVADDHRYGWTLSCSECAPLVNAGSPLGVPGTLYLWFYCSTEDGASEAEFDIASTGATVLSATGQNGWINSGSASNLRLSIGSCPTGPMIAATILVLDATGSEFCIVPSAENGLNVTWDCQPVPVAYLNDTGGYSTLGSSPSCVDLFCVSEPQFGWTISRSTTNPFVNSGPPAGGVQTLYLWLWCDVLGNGVAEAQFDLSATGGLAPLAFSPMPGFLNAGTHTALSIVTIGCEAAPVMVGEIIANDLGGEICLVKSSDDLNDSRGCGSERFFNNATIGYTSSGALSCNDEFPCFVPADSPPTVDRTGTHLSQNVPNPFVPDTRISFTLDEEALAAVTVYDVSGRHVRTLVDRRLASGPHEVIWDGLDDDGQRLASGTYFYDLRVDGERTEVRSAVLLR